MAYLIHIQKGKGSKIATPITNEEQFRLARTTQRHTSAIASIRSGELTADEIKKLKATSLASFMYQGHPNDDGTIKGSTRLSRHFIFDIDDKREADRVWEILRPDPSAYDIDLAERSVQGGLHAVGKRPWGKTILECQCELALKLHCEIDLNNKDSTRNCFGTGNTPEDLLYINEGLFADTFNAEEWAREEEEMKARTPDLPLMPQKADKHYKVWEHSWPSHGINIDQPSAANSADDVSIRDTINHDVTIRDTISAPAPDVSRTYPTEYMGIPYSTIISKYWLINNDGNEPCEGNRNSLTYELACTIAPICDYSHQWLMQVIPRYDGMPEDEWLQTIVNACKETKKGMSYRLRKAIDAAKRDVKVSIATGGTASTPPAMPAKLTKFHRDLISRAPKIYWPTICEGVWQAVAAHLSNVTFRYIDGKSHEPHSFGLLVAPMSTGKGCIDEPIKYLMDDIRRRDRPSRQKESEWKRKSGADGEKKVRPTDICIQYLMSDATHAAFIRRLIDVDANGHRALYMKVDEVELLDGIKGTGKNDTVFSYIKLNYDTATVGQERVGADSIDGQAPLRWNCNASSTPARARKYFRKVVNDGTLSRINMNTVEVPEDNNEIPVFKIYDEKYADLLKPYIDLLNEASGEIRCSQALKLARQLDSENKERAALCDSKAYERLSFRANVNAYHKAMMLYILNGYKWSKDIENYVRWSEQRDLWCKMRYFQDYLEEELKNEEKAVNAAPQNLLTQLPEEFTYQDVVELRIREGKSADGRALIRKWVARGYIERTDSADTYSKKGKYSICNTGVTA